MDSERFELVRKIHLNGIYAMHHVLVSGAPYSPITSNTEWWDCRIGVVNSSLAKKLWHDRLPEFAQRFLDIAHAQEVCHCSQKAGSPPSPLAERIAEFHRKALEKSFVAWLACQPLIGEKMALATAIKYRSESDPHSTIQGALSEEYHQSLALAVLVALDPSREELEFALKCQEEMLAMMGINDRDRNIIGADGEVCTVASRAYHQK